MSKDNAKSRSRTPPSRGEVLEDGGIANDFDDMWASLEPKLNNFKGEVKEAVKSLVVGKIEDLEKRMDQKIDEVKAETKGVKDSVLRIEQLLAKSASVPSVCIAAL